MSLFRNSYFPSCSLIFLNVCFNIFTDIPIIYIYIYFGSIDELAKLDKGFPFKFGFVGEGDGLETSMQCTVITRLSQELSVYWTGSSQRAGAMFKGLWAAPRNAG